MLKIDCLLHLDILRITKVDNTGTDRLLHVLGDLGDVGRASEREVVRAVGILALLSIRADEDRIAGAYGTNFARLAQIKAKYDPGNFFRVNQNVVPTG